MCDVVATSCVRTLSTDALAALSGAPKPRPLPLAGSTLELSKTCPATCRSLHRDLSKSRSPIIESKCMGNARLICVWIMQIDLTQKKSPRAPRRSNLPRSHVEIKRSDGTTCRSLLRDLPTCRTASGGGREDWSGSGKGRAVLVTVRDYHLTCRHQQSSWT